MSILASYDGPAKEVGFTLVVLAKQGIKVSWIEDPPPLVYTEKASRILSLPFPLVDFGPGERRDNDSKCWGKLQVSHIHAQPTVSSQYICSSRAYGQDQRFQGNHIL